MAPGQDEDTGRTANRPPGEKEDPRRKAAPEVGVEVDGREEDGWDQPQSSAQKGPTSTREPEE
jgi:hypothetical protein